MTTKENTKVIVRLLPANLSADGFWKLIEDKIQAKYAYWYYSPGKTGQKKHIHSRAYIYFKNHDSVCEFNEFFNGHVFVNSKGVEERAVVEYAPYQKMPKLKKRPDLRMGSINEDADYLAFVEKLKEQPTILPSAEVQLDRRLAEEKEKIAAAGGVMPAIVTPLMEDIRAKRAARNAPRTILQAPKRRSDRSGEKKRTKDDKEKRDAKATAKPRDRSSRRRRDRDERKKKKKDKDDQEHTEEGQSQPSTNQPNQPQPQTQSTAIPTEKTKSSRNGLWMIRNHITNMEPGSVTIQTRGGAASTGASPSAKNVNGQQSQPQPLQSTLSQPQLASLPTPPPIQSSQSLSSLPSQTQPTAPSQSGQGRRSREANTSDRDFNRNRGRRDSKKIYTPKQQQPQTQTNQPPPAASQPAQPQYPPQPSLQQQFKSTLAPQPAVALAGANKKGV